jgi:hypothetical protein
VTDVFDQNTPPNTPIVSSDPFADKLKTIVNDQGQPKYETTDKALEALAASQAHIKKLEDEAKAREQETARLREEATKASALEEIVQRLTGTPNKAKEVETPTNPVDVEKVIAEKITQVLSVEKQKEAANANGLVVRNALVTKFGDLDKARDAVNAKAAELGMTNESLGTLSAQNPKLVLTLFGLSAPNSTSNVTTPSSTPLQPVQKDESLKAPDKSLISGLHATDANRKELMRKIKEQVYKQYDVTV